MSIKGRFVALLTLLVLLLALLMNSHSISSPHVKSREPINILTVIMVVGVLAGLTALIVLYIYFRDIKGAKREFQESPWGPVAKAVATIVLSLFLLLLLRFLGMEPSVNGNTTNVSANGTCVRIDGTLLNCSVAGLKPLATANGTGSPSFSSNPLFTNLYLIFLLPVLGAFAYLGFHFYRLGMAERERKRKVKLAMSFDRKLEERGLEDFSDPMEAVVAIYKNAVLWLEGLGIPYKESWTHWEHAGHVRYMHEAFVALTRLFEKAKYAPERLTWEDAAKALEVYERLRGNAREFMEKG